MYIFLQPRERPCIHMSLNNMSVFTAPAPFGGPQLLTALQLLRNTNLTTHLPLSNFYHSFIEAIRRSYAGFVSLGKEVRFASIRSGFGAVVSWVVRAVRAKTCDDRSHRISRVHRNALMLIGSSRHLIIGHLALTYSQ